jgi:hypothetical protein
MRPMSKPSRFTCKHYLAVCFVGALSCLSWSQQLQKDAADGRDAALTIRSTAQFGAEGPVVWTLHSAKSGNGQLALQLADGMGDVMINPWPRAQHRRGGLALGLASQHIAPGAVKITAVQIPQPFGPAQKLSVQHSASQQPAMVLQTRGQSGQTVVDGWRALYAGNHWVLQSDATAAQTLDASRAQRIRAAGHSWCVYPSARAENQETPPLLDWVLVATNAQRRC